MASSKKQVKIKHEKIREFLLQYIITHSKLPDRNQSYGFSKQRLYYHVSKLKKKSAIERVGYAVWRVTEIGQNLLRGSRESSKNIEIWGAGYKFLPDKTFIIENLKKIPRIKNRVKIYQGWLNGCWVKHSSSDTTSSIIIKSPVERSDDVFEAWTSAMNKVQECKKFLEDKYLVKLIPIERTEPDFIIRTPEGKKIAQQILNKYGRIRTDHVNIDISKTGTPENPDFEVSTLEDAINVVDNFAVQNKAEQIMSMMIKWNKNFEMHYSVLNETKNAMKNNNKIMKEIKNVIVRLEKTIKKPRVVRKVVKKVVPKSVKKVLHKPKKKILAKKKRLPTAEEILRGL